MPFDWNTGALAEGLRCYRNQEFWHAHEHWEGVWLKCGEPEKTFIQALIQTTAAFHHQQRGNRLGTGSLLKTALRKLDLFPHVYGGIEVEELRSGMREWLQALEQDGPIEGLQFPAIRPA